MLRSLYLKNIALVDEAEIVFSEGLNVLSGETGAGKSVILDSIDFVLGAKADKGMIRSGQSECSVRAEFTCDPELLRPVLEELDLEESDSLLIVRRLNTEGRGSLKVNGCPITATMLRKLTSQLVDVHGQSEHFFLLKETNQLRLLDQIAGTEQERAEVASLLKERRSYVEKLSSLGGDEGERERRADILRFQIDELENAALKEGEEEELTALRTKYQNAEKILSGLKTVRDALLSDGGAADCVNLAHRGLISIEKYGDYAALSERLENALAEIEDIGGTAESLAEELDIDDREAERVENRLDEIRSLKKKYGGSVEEALGFLARAKEELQLLENSAEECEKLKALLAGNAKKLYSACRMLTKKRKEGAEGFTLRVTEELKTLNIPSARFEIAFELYSEEDLPRANAEGLDRVKFLFSANAGEPVKELGIFSMRSTRASAERRRASLQKNSRISRKPHRSSPSPILRRSQRLPTGNSSSKRRRRGGEHTPASVLSKKKSAQKNLSVSWAETRAARRFCTPMNFSTMPAPINGLTHPEKNRIFY